jgi:hypothetical protein
MSQDLDRGIESSFHPKRKVGLERIPRTALSFDRAMEGQPPTSKVVLFQDLNKKLEERRVLAVCLALEQII